MTFDALATAAFCRRPTLLFDARVQAVASMPDDDDAGHETRPTGLGKAPTAMTAAEQSAQRAARAKVRGTVTQESE